MPSGISCPGTCKALFAEGVVILKASPALGSTLWKGCTSVEDDLCIVNMKKNTTVTVHCSPKIEGSVK